MKPIFSPAPNEEKLLKEYKARFANDSKEELMATFNRQKRLGMTGVRAQSLYILALHQTFLERFGESPISVRSVTD